MSWPRRNKYRAVAVTIDGVRFDSKAEAQRFQNLRYLERAGQIKDLQVHPSWPLHVFQVFPCAAHDAADEMRPTLALPCVGKFTPDFWYVDASTGEVIVEDVKSPITAKETAYRLRKRMWEAQYGFRLTEVLS